MGKKKHRKNTGEIDEIIFPERPDKTKAKTPPKIIPIDTFNAISEYMLQLSAPHRNVFLSVGEYSMEYINPMHLKTKDSPTHMIVFCMRLITEDYFSPIGVVQVNKRIDQTDKLLTVWKAFIQDLAILRLHVIGSISPTSPIFHDVLSKLTENPNLEEHTGPITYPVWPYDEILHLYDYDDLMLTFQEKFCRHVDLHFMARPPSGSNDLKLYSACWTDLLLSSDGVTSIYTPESTKEIELSIFSPKFKAKYEQISNKGFISTDTKSSTQRLMDILWKYASIETNVTISPDDLKDIYNKNEDFRIMLASARFRSSNIKNTRIENTTDTKYRRSSRNNGKFGNGLVSPKADQADVQTKAITKATCNTANGPVALINRTSINTNTDKSNVRSDKCIESFLNSEASNDLHTNEVTTVNSIELSENEMDYIMTIINNSIEPDSDEFSKNTPFDIFLRKMVYDDYDFFIKTSATIGSGKFRSSDEQKLIAFRAEQAFVHDHDYLKRDYPDDSRDYFKKEDVETASAEIQPQSEVATLLKDYFDGLRKKHSLRKKNKNLQSSQNEYIGDSKSYNGGDIIDAIEYSENVPVAKPNSPKITKKTAIHVKDNNLNTATKQSSSEYMRELQSELLTDHGNYFDIKNDFSNVNTTYVTKRENKPKNPFGRSPPSDDCMLIEYNTPNMPRHNCDNCDEQCKLNECNNKNTYEIGRSRSVNMTKWSENDYNKDNNQNGEYEVPLGVLINQVTSATAVLKDVRTNRLTQISDTDKTDKENEGIVSQINKLSPFIQAVSTDSDVCNKLIENVKESPQYCLTLNTVQNDYTKLHNSDSSLNNKVFYLSEVDESDFKNIDHNLCHTQIPLGFNTIVSTGKVTDASNNNKDNTSELNFNYSQHHSEDSDTIKKAVEKLPDVFYSSEGFDISDSDQSYNRTLDGLDLANDTHCILDNLTTSLINTATDDSNIVVSDNTFPDAIMVIQDKIDINVTPSGSLDSLAELSSTFEEGAGETMLYSKYAIPKKAPISSSMATPTKKVLNMSNVSDVLDCSGACQVTTNSKKKKNRKSKKARSSTSDSILLTEDYSKNITNLLSLRKTYEIVKNRNHFLSGKRKVKTPIEELEALIEQVNARQQSSNTSNKDNNIITQSTSSKRSTDLPTNSARGSKNYPSANTRQSTLSKTEDKRFMTAMTSNIQLSNKEFTNGMKNAAFKNNLINSKKIGENFERFSQRMNDQTAGCFDRNSLLSPCCRVPCTSSDIHTPFFDVKEVMSLPYYTKFAISDSSSSSEDVAFYPAGNTMKVNGTIAVQTVPASERHSEPVSNNVQNSDDFFEVKEVISLPHYTKFAISDSNSSYEDVAFSPAGNTMKVNGTIAVETVPASERHSQPVPNNLQNSDDEKDLVHWQERRRSISVFCDSKKPDCDIIFKDKDTFNKLFSSTPKDSEVLRVMTDWLCTFKGYLKLQEILQQRKVKTIKSKLLCLDHIDFYIALLKKLKNNDLSVIYEGPFYKFVDHECAFQLLLPDQGLYILRHDEESNKSL